MSTNYNGGKRSLSSFQSTRPVSQTGSFHDSRINQLLNFSVLIRSKFATEVFRLLKLVELNAVVENELDLGGGERSLLLQTGKCKQ